MTIRTTIHFLLTVPDSTMTTHYLMTRKGKLMGGSASLIETGAAPKQHISNRIFVAPLFEFLRKNHECSL